MSFYNMNLLDFELVLKYLRDKFPHVFIWEKS